MRPRSVQSKLTTKAFAQILSACLLLLARPTWAGECQVSIAANDPSAQLFVNGTPVVVAPVGQRTILKCASERQIVRVVSSDNQNFTRSIPAASEFRSSSERFVEWNINFLRINDLAYRGESPTRMIADSQDQASVLQELASLRAMVQTLMTRTENLAVKSVSPKREVAQVGTANAGESEDGERHAGYFVQIYSIPSLRAGHYPILKRERQLIDEEKIRSNSELLGCRWIKNFHLTRVLVGPLLNRPTADHFASEVGRDAFVVENPRCGGES